ncbi:putative transcriptional regulator [Ureibacillus xyleni]|uniref:Putative transcriptional regulator n=1 Tax=Ureibacillus xyleni TaxID=614648 RepID=A0A285SXY7_9BACL|nr:helix-turn-helix transcriptional regulator [Ureibacillus xyleni]SOC12931.1 putative transcriptional regulator [Ureibacillus xyleni]
MPVRVKSNLKAILDERNISIRQLTGMAGISFESARRLYNDDTKQYQRDTLGAVCNALNIEIGELLILVKEPTKSEDE